jgi:hypothetical protein
VAYDLLQTLAYNIFLAHTKTVQIHNTTKTLQGKLSFRSVVGFLPSAAEIALIDKWLYERSLVKNREVKIV